MPQKTNSTSQIVCYMYITPIVVENGGAARWDAVNIALVHHMVASEADCAGNEALFLLLYENVYFNVRFYNLTRSWHLNCYSLVWLNIIIVTWFHRSRH